MILDPYFMFAILSSVSAVNAKLFLPVNNNDDFLLNFANSTSHACKRDFTLLAESLCNNTLWAYRMWDATAKYPTGLTEGSVYQLGNFDECLSIDQSFPAQYCLTTIKYTIVLNTTIKDPFSLEYDPYDSVYNKLYHTGDRNKIHRDKVHWGFCVPASCNSYEIQRALQAYLDKQITANIKKYQVTLEETDCQTKPSIDVSYNIVNSSFCKIIIICMIFVTMGTVIDLKYCSNSDIVPNGRIKELLLCFSAKRSYKVLTIPDQLPALHGVKFLLSCIIIIGHHFIMKLAGPISNIEKLEQINRSPTAMLLGRADLLMEIYFFISGVLITYQMQSKKRNVNPFSGIIIRYFRFMPVFALVTLFYTTVMSNTGSGPLWSRIIGLEIKKCQKNWWLNLFLLNNYIDVVNICVINGWYLAADFQFFLLSIPLNMLMNKMPNGRIKIFLAILFVSVLIPFAIAIYHKIDPIFLFYNDVHEVLLKSDYTVKLYFPFHARTTTYILGMAFGFVYCNLKNSKIELSVFKSALLIVTSLAVMLACTIGSVRYYNPYKTFSTLEAASFIAFNKFGYPMAIGLLTLVIGYGALFPRIPKFLSWSPFVPLSKLALNANMVHIVLQLVNTASQRAPATLNLGNLLNGMLADIVLAQIIAFVLFICIENPISRFMKQLLNSEAHEKNE